MKKRKGIILAGGEGTRLYPLTIGISKQLLPVYDKPMIYYPLTVLMLSGIREILIISTPEDLFQYKRVLGDGSQWGVRFSYKVQPSPDGLAQAFIIGEDFLDGAPSALILGDNIFFGHGLPRILKKANEKRSGATVFGYHVNDPERYGVIGFDENGQVRSITEKPKIPESNYAVTGLYFLDHSASSRAKLIEPSKRGELEITSLLEDYLAEDILTIEKMGRGFAWLDTGTHSSLLEAGNFVRTLTERQGLQVGSPDEVAYLLKLITREQLQTNLKVYGNNAYGAYLSQLIDKMK
ncbi:glucose-1-phosphate thymidylyltransferase RfbA [Paracoccaceae bacterium]|nr:glucose-1-phosphate thymidylyltransferase RfbA [Paracoccaceae bacterium]